VCRRESHRPSPLQATALNGPSVPNLPSIDPTHDAARNRHRVDAFRRLRDSSSRAPKMRSRLSIRGRLVRRFEEGDLDAIRDAGAGREKTAAVSIRRRLDRRPDESATGNPRPGDTTMRFMMLMIPRGYESAAPGTVPDAKAVAAMTRYNESLQKAGVLLALDGLHPPSMGARVTFAGGKPKVTDGPFAEAKEVLGGYWMIQVKSREEAIEWAKRCPASANELIEIRQVQEMADFPADVQAAAGNFADLQPKS
jgi:hypothetical protein